MFDLNSPVIMHTSNTSDQHNEAQTFSYKQVDGFTIQLDVYPPNELPSKPVPAVVFFHGGGLSVGNRTSWFPDWLKSLS